jgi:hypothetical protein
MKDKEKEEDQVKNNVVTIASRPIEVYINTITKKFCYNDQVELHCVARYLPLIYEIIGMLSNAYGIEPDTSDKKIHFITSEEDLFNKETGESYNQPVHRITLTKQPDQFRFTKQ